MNTFQFFCDRSFSESKLLYVIRKCSICHRCSVDLKPSKTETVEVKSGRIVQGHSKGSDTFKKQTVDSSYVKEKTKKKLVSENKTFPVVSEFFWDSLVYRKKKGMTTNGKGP